MIFDPFDVIDARIGELLRTRAHLQDRHDSRVMQEHGIENYKAAYPLTLDATVWLLATLDQLVAEQQAQRKRAEYGRAELAPPTRPLPVNLRSRGGRFSRLWRDLAEWSSCR